LAGAAPGNPPVNLPHWRFEVGAVWIGIWIVAVSVFVIALFNKRG